MSHYRKHHPKHHPTADAGAQSPPEQSGKSTAAATEHNLVASLFQELFQEEQSARLHPLREASRLGEVPPAAALRAVSEHAAGALSQLPELAEKNQVSFSAAGKALGFFLSQFRQLVIDRLVEMERSYRGTLAGMRHGIDLVELLGHVAQAQGNSELARWCTGWLSERRPLVEAVARELAWFAQEPEVATSRPGPLELLGRLKSLMPQPGRVNTEAVASR